MNYRRFNIFLFALAILVPISPTSTAAIFGDGNPANGIEDQRLLAPIDLQRSVGTVICDGGLRGTAVHINLCTVIVTPMQQALDCSYRCPCFIPSGYGSSATKECAYHPQGKRLSGVVFARVSAHDFKPTTQ